MINKPVEEMTYSELLSMRDELYHILDQVEWEIKVRETEEEEEEEFQIVEQAVSECYANEY